MIHKKKGSTGRFLSILLAAAMALTWMPADILSSAVYAEETDKGAGEDNGTAGVEKSISPEKGGNAVPPEESGAGEAAAEEPETAAGNTEGPENGTGSTEGPETAAGSTERPENGAGSTEEPGKEPAGTEKEDTAACVCRTLCTADSVNADCPVCGAEGDGIVGCKGEPEAVKDPEPEDTENAENPEPEDTKKEDTEQEDKEEENTEQEDTQDIGLCRHHPEHAEDCGYTKGTQDKEGTPCTYACRICPIEDLIAALPDEVTADNAEDVRAQLDEILALYRELTEEEQDQIDLSRCYALQKALDKANAPEQLAGDVSADYREAHWDESSQTVVYEDRTAGSCTAVTDSGAEVTWDAGWYVVNSTVTVSEPVTVNGEVHLILADDGTLDAQKGIVVSNGSSLTIYGQTGGTGKLTATGATGCAGIGGGTEESDRDSGAITICGGTVEAAGGLYGAGIGGGKSGTGNNITIYGGEVTATGGESGAGIGGGYGINAGGAGSKITICGGTVKATGSEYGAGIGGGWRGTGSEITICGGTVTATGSEYGAGIGGGYGGAGSNIEINGGEVTATSDRYGAGIGGGISGAGSNIEINGGTVKVTGGYDGAGIGGGYSGAGSNIKINGGTVTATGGYDGVGIGGGWKGTGSNIEISGGTVTATGGYDGAGIGGGWKGTGSEITISGGTVTATSGNGAGIGGGNNGGTSTGFSTGDDGSAVIFTNSIGDTSDQDNWNGVIFQGNEGQVYGDVTLTEDVEIPSGKTLTIPDGSSLTISAGASITNKGDLIIDGGELSGGGTLAGGGTFITDLTADMIIVSTGRYYTPGLTETELEKKISISGGSKTILGQTFTVDPDDWTLSVTRVSDLEYTATYTNNSDSSKKVSKTITFLQSGTEFVGNDAVNTYKGEAKTDTFAYGDIITVKATPTATGAAPLMAASLDEPAAGQMAVYYKDVQVSAPSTEADGVHTMTVDTADLGLTEQDLNKKITLTVKYTASPAMAGAESTVEVTVAAAAKVELSGNTTYVNDLQAAFDMSHGLSVTTWVTLLRDVALTDCVNVTSGFFALDLNGHTITGGDKAFSVDFGIFTIKNTETAGGITASGNAIEVSGGWVTLDDGCACSSTGDGCGVSVTGGTVNVIGKNVVIKRLSVTDGKLQVSGESVEIEELSVSGSGSAVLFSGTYKGAPAIQTTSGTLKDLQYSRPDKNEYYAYFLNGKPIDLTTLQNQKELSGTVTVKECTHEGVSDCQSNNNGTHTVTCRACKYSETADCTCIFGGTVEGTTVYPTETCTVCGYINHLGYVTVTIPKLIYGETAGKKNEFRVETDIQFDSYQPLIDIDGIDINSDYFEQILAGLSAGEYEDRLKLRIYRAGTGGFRFPIPFTIEKAELTESMVTLAPENATYTGAAQKPAVTVKQGTTTLTEGTDYTVSYSGNDFTNTGTVTVTVTGKGNYTGTATKEYTISYMYPPELLYNGSSEMRSYYNGDVTVTADPSGSNTYTVSDAINGTYGGSYTIRAQEGTVEKTLYFKDGDGHISAGVPVTVNFDLTSPTGGISVGAKWWQNALHFVSFGHYKVQEYTVTIKAEDKGGSGIGSIDYAIVTGETQYADVNALENAVKDGTVSWTEYESGSKPTIPANSPCVVYARLTDNAGNITYISTEGMILDNTPPVVEELAVPEDGIKDVTAGITFTVSEAADYYYVVLEEGSTAPFAEDIIVTCGGTLPAGSGKTGTSIAGTVDSGRGAVSADTFPAGVSVDVKNLSPNTAYTVYVTAVDRALDIENRTLAGNIGNVAGIKDGLSFRTKKTLPVITGNPAVSGTYGQSVGEMAVTGGTAQGAGGAALTGTWAVSATDSGKEPAAGTKEEVTVTFTPENDSYDSISVKVIPAVSPRSLSAPDVIISDVAGTYTYTGSEIKPPVAVNTGTPASGISISDSGAVLTANDLTISYRNNMNAGTASVTITGTGNYTGSVTKTFTIGKAPGRTIDSLSGTPAVDDKSQTYTCTITPIGGAVYRMGDSGGWTEPGQKNGNVFTGIKPGTSVVFYAKMPETGNYEEGPEKSTTVDFPKLPQTAPMLSYTRETDAAGNITLTIAEVTGAEYSFDGGRTWTDSSVKDGLNASQTVTLAIRLEETDTHEPSPAQTVTVDLAKEDRDAPSAFALTYAANGETDYTVTIPPTEGCEYSFDGGTWDNNNVKTGVKVGETVTGYKRYKETDKYNASGVASAKETMPKFTVKTPVISPAGGSCPGSISISVTITCGTPGAQIYYTTDGSTPGRSSTRYTGAFTVSAPAVVRAIAVKDGFLDSAAASETYTAKDSGPGSSGGGNGGGSGDRSGGNDPDGSGSGNGDGGEPGGGNTAPAIPTIPPADAITGQGTGPVKPGRGRTGNGTGSPAAGTKQPFIKGADGGNGWDAIRTKGESAEEGSVISVDMNGSTVVPGAVFDSIRGKDVTITFDMGNGIVWSVDGKSIAADRSGDIDFSVKTGTNTIPVDIMNNVTGERYGIQFSLSCEGEFGLTAVLSMDLGRENAGYTASLYAYNESTGELELLCADKIAEDGVVSLALTRAPAACAIVVDGGPEPEAGDGGTDTQPEKAGEPDKAAADDAAAEEGPETRPETKPVWPAAAAVPILTGACIAAAFAWKKRKKGKDMK